MSEILITETTDASILRGVELLDERDAGWESRVPLEDLDMLWHGRCLLSLLFGSYEEGILQLDIGPLIIEVECAGSLCLDACGWEYGFTVPPTTTPDDAENAFAQLTATWKQVIAQKRQADGSVGRSMRPRCASEGSAGT